MQRTARGYIYIRTSLSVSYRLHIPRAWKIGVPKCKKDQTCGLRESGNKEEVKKESTNE